MIYIIATLVFVLLQAFHSGIETGLVSLQRSRVRNGIKQGLKGAEILDYFLRHPSLMLSTCLLGTNICVVCSSIMAKKAATSFGYGTNYGLVITVILLTFILLTAEIVPKNWFRQQPYERCMLFVNVLYCSYFLLYYPILLLSGFTERVTKLSSVSSNPDTVNTLMREDFRILLRESEGYGLIDSEAVDILERAMDFHTIRVETIMITKEKVHDLPADTKIRDALLFCQENNISRVPVLQHIDGRKIWCGIFSIYDAIFNIEEEQWDHKMISDCLVPVNTIPENVSLNEVLIRTQQRYCATPLLIVTAKEDKSDHVGIITPIDVVRCLFGEVD